MSKVLVISDLHADASTAGVERIDDVGSALDLVYRHAREFEPSLVVCLGDLCDPDSPSLIRCMCVAREFALSLAAERIPVLWLAGNHDVLEDGHGTTTLDLLGVPSGLSRVVTKPCIADFRDFTVACLPYTALAGNYDPLKELNRMAIERNAADVKLVVGHLMLEGIGLGSETEDFPRGRDVFFPIEEARRLFPNAVLLNGHYHERQVYRGVHIPGALVRLTRSDAGRQPCFLEIEV